MLAFTFLEREKKRSKTLHFFWNLPGQDFRPVYIAQMGCALKTVDAPANYSFADRSRYSKGNWIFQFTFVSTARILKEKSWLTSKEATSLYTPKKFLPAIFFFSKSSARDDRSFLAMKNGKSLTKISVRSLCKFSWESHEKRKKAKFLMRFSWALRILTKEYKSLVDFTKKNANNSSLVCATDSNVCHHSEFVERKREREREREKDMQTERDKEKSGYLAACVL